MRLRGTALAVASVLALTACNGSGDDRPDPWGPDHNDADERYVQLELGSIAVVRQTAATAEGRSDSDEVLDLAEEIAEELDDVLDQLTAWEREWDLPQIVYDGAASLPAQQPGPDWQELYELEGEEFDALWVELLREELDATKSSADTVVSRGENTDLRDLATQLADDCARWLQELEDLAP